MWNLVNVKLKKSTKDKNVQQTWRKAEGKKLKRETKLYTPCRNDKLCHEIVQAVTVRAHRPDERIQSCPPCWLSCSVLLLHCDRPTIATILAPRLERRFLFPTRPVASGPVLLGLFSKLYMAPLMLELRTTFLAATALIPPGLGTSTELLSIMVPHKPLSTGLDWGWEEDNGRKVRQNNSIMNQCVF